MGHFEWLPELHRQLKHISEESYYLDRGAYALREPDVHVIFGNRSDEEVLLLRHVLPELATTILAYGEAEDEPTWAMIVRGPLDAEQLSEIVWTAWEASEPAEQADAAEIGFELPAVGSW